MTFLPLLGAALLYVVPAPRGWRFIAITASAATLALAVLCAARLDWSSGAVQLEERASWVPAIGASYHLGVDGLSLPLLLLTAFLTLLVVVQSLRMDKRPREWFALFLVMETGLLGVFSSLDLLLFYVFWEVALVPMYFVIGAWGHERRVEASLKFFLYTRVGSLAMLLSILALYLRIEPHTFDLPAIVAARPFAAASTAAAFVLLGFFVAFAIKLPAIPFHSWLPDAHTEAPTAGSVILAGILLKMGGYGFLRLAWPTVPAALASWSRPIAALAVISAIYGAAVAMAQRDLKRLVALTSVNHMGYVLLAVAVAAAPGASAADRAAAATGAGYQMIAHGLVTGGLFFAVGMLADRTGTREIARLSGLWSGFPAGGALFTFLAFASLGLPGLAQFAAEVQIVLGALGVWRWAAVGMLVAVLLTTGLFVWTLQRVVFGKVPPQWAALRGLDGRELAIAASLVALVVALGLFPGPLTALLRSAVSRGVTTVAGH